MTVISQRVSLLSLSLSLSLCLLGACSAENTGAGGAHLKVTGQSPPTDVDQQYETVASVQAFNCYPDPCTAPPSIVDVTYNDETGELENGFVTYPPGSRVAYPGYSALGYSVSTDSGISFHYQSVPKLRPPNFGQPGGWDALWGDPGMTHSRFDVNNVYISSLAISHQSMMNAGGSIIGSVLFACGCNFCSRIDGACIARSHDGGVNFEPIQPLDCLTDNGHFYDGGSMESGLDGKVYAAFNDVTASQIDIWSTMDPGGPFSLMSPGPFQGQTIISHPRLRYDYQTGRLYVMALGTTNLCTPQFTDDGQQLGQLLIDYWDGATWHGAVAIGTNDALQYPKIPRGFILGAPGDIRRGTQFSFDVGTPSVNANDDIRIVYTSEYWSPGRPSLRSFICTRDLQCTNAGFAWSTHVTPGKQFDPVVIAQPWFISVPAEWVVSYNSTEFDPNNTGTTLSFMTAKLQVDSQGHQVPWAPAPLVQNTPLCPELDGQWGDYDDLRVLTIKNNVPIFIRTHTDSTDPTCQSRDQFIASPMHVSAHTFQ